jgi:hypothetical protein
MNNAYTGANKMASNKLFTIAGTSKLNSVVTFRFATGEAKKREWVLRHNGHEDIALTDLPKPMMKLDAAAFLKTQNWVGADIAVLPGAGSEKGETAEQLAARLEAEKAAAEAAKKEAKNAARRAQRAAAKAAKIAAENEAFVNGTEIPVVAEAAVEDVEPVEFVDAEVDASDIED